MVSKPQLRTKYKQLRSQLSVDTIEDRSIEIANLALQLPIWDKTNYHLFLSIEEQKEVNSDYLLNILSGKDKNIIVSKSNFEDYSLTHYLLTDNTVIRKNKYNIPEPQDGIKIGADAIEVVFIPLLVFDKKGNRIGYGKGFYDRFLNECQPNTIKIGVSFFEPENQDIPSETTDIGLDYCITPNKTYTF
ncbi:MAG: 5-formyltetrahydrofolate cyclo-ligase [Bacteroidetes bacterium MedPE-SWsnd-G2]|nr:MAG: 5-formyltetrahydrofolate cyclo-ligase [Bacteroidetes bacterium MedPE-SWsnd-G2]